MVNKCAVYGCESGYTAKKKKKTEDGSNKRPVVAAFRFPLKKVRVAGKVGKVYQPQRVEST